MQQPYDRSCPYIYRGVVESNTDPLNLGRCKIRVPSIHGELSYPVDLLPWARPIALSPIKKGRGSVNLPDVGDIVWVFFEGAVREFPVYFGGTYATGELNIDKDIVHLYIEDNNSISYNRRTKTLKFCVGDNQIDISPESISIKGDINLKGDVSIDGSLRVSKTLRVDSDLSVAGTATVNNLVIQGSCNRECLYEHN